MYARDPRTMKTQSIANPYSIYYLNANNCTEIGDDQNGTYPLNKEAIWQITIPKDHVAYVVLPFLDLEAVSMTMSQFILIVIHQ